MGTNKRTLTLGLIAVILAGAFYAAFSTYQENHAREYALRALPAKTKQVAAPVLPDISGFTAEAVISRIPASVPGVVKAVSPDDCAAFQNMALPREGLKKTMGTKQQTDKPVLIELVSGVYTLSELTDAIANPDYLEKTANGYALKVPLIIDKDGALIIQGTPEAKQVLRLAEEGGTFISVFGKFFAIDSRVSGWRLTRNQPSLFVDKEMFRPFLLFWSRAESYIARSEVLHMGFASPKMYGLSYSSDMETRGNHRGIQTSAWIIDSLIEDLYYGFYSYEVNDIAIIRNELKNNIIYGVDPHDRSERLIIAYNNSYGAKKRHGIIVSREVDNSWIFNNHSHHNHGAGVMLDRNSVNNVVAYNTLEYNGSDGLVFFESPNNLSYENQMRYNGKSGIRIRNSWDVKIAKDKIFDNQGHALLAYTTELDSNINAKATRDSKMDPYGMQAAFDMIDVELNNNLSGNFNLMNLQRAGFYNLSIFKSPGGHFEGDSAIKDIQYSLYEKASKGAAGIEIYQLNYTPKYSEFWGQQTHGSTE